ncbi:hypothetical protein PCAR4_810098 [Paraburkholderia caribensis]|nr:hypothetical protein PCAR4_810098 [Paraburkholderia caribensis]
MPSAYSQPIVNRGLLNNLMPLILIRDLYFRKSNLHQDISSRNGKRQRVVSVTGHRKDQEW